MLSEKEFGLKKKKNWSVKKIGFKKSLVLKNSGSEKKQNLD